jgi:hypothetical protein
MKDTLKSKSIFIIAGVLVVLVIAIIVVLIRIGNAYRKGLSQIDNQPPPQDVTHIVRKKISKIIIKKNANDAGCVEVTPDGIVRTYSVCDTQLSSANRMNDASNIIHLFALAGQTDYTSDATSTDAVAACTGYIMTIQTDDGTKQSVCMKSSAGGGGGTGGGVTGGGGGGGTSPIGEIIDTIKKVIDDIPPTPTEIQPTVTGIPTPVISDTLAPTFSYVPGDQPTPTPTPQVMHPFTCGYWVDANGHRHPYNVSNVICSDQPVPGQ